MNEVNHSIELQITSLTGMGGILYMRFLQREISSNFFNKLHWLKGKLTDLVFLYNSGRVATIDLIVNRPLIVHLSLHAR